MKKFKKIASLVVASAMLTSSLAFTVSASAAEMSAESVSAIDVSTQKEVGDGVILHAFNWSYNSIKENLPAIKAAGYSTVQTSPVQQAKDFGASKDVSGQWWKLYQPVSMSIAQKSWLGTKDDLKSLCSEADKYGIKIICDIVSNHFGNEVETDPNSISTQVETYQPDFYNNASTYFHSYTKGADDSSVQGVVQGHVSACPDLNTGNKNVQNAVVSLLKECIDCGVDGFRFDAAKHIETPNDGSYGSDYWPTITNAAKEYYTQKTGGNLFIYGEILNTCGAGRQYSAYTNYINVTDNRTGDAVLYNVINGNTSGAANANYKSGVSAKKAVLWAESHDTYEGTAGSAGIANTASVSDENIIKAWAIVGSRKDSTALYLARPGSALMGQAGTDTAYKSTAVSEINKFHNKFVGQSEKLGSSGTFAYVARGNSGIVIVNCNGTATNANISGTGLADGSYTDTITGNKFTVSGGTLTGAVGSTGVAVVYNGTTTPRNTVSVESGSFSDDTMVVTLGLDNATSGTYSLDGSAPVAYTGKVAIRIGSDYEYGETINLTVTATDGKETTSATYKYSKEKSASSGVYVFFNSARKSTWKAPFHAYIYDEDTEPGKTYTNSSWPGETMKYDEGSGYYYIEVSDSTCLVNNEEGGNFDLAHSKNTYIIFNDSAATLHQYPGDGSRTKLAINGSSKIYALSGSNTFEDTTLVPTKVKQEATDVTKGNVQPTTAAPTTVKPQPTTAKPQPTTVPSTTVKPTTPSTRVYGDVDNDGVVSINDVTILQKYVVESITLTPDAIEAADVSGDGEVSIEDATLIQKYLASFADFGRTGKPINPVQPTTAEPTEAPTTAKPTQPATTAKPTQPTTSPVTQPIGSAKFVLVCDKGDLGFFENGTLTCTFAQDSYVWIRNYDTGVQYCTDGWQGFVDEVTLVNEKVAKQFNKLYVPAGTQTFTLINNNDDTFTLSYGDVSPTTPTQPATVAPTTVPVPTTVPSSEYTMYFKTTLGWMTADGVNLYAYDTNSGESYQFEKDEDAYPNVYTIEVPESVSDVIVYRSLEEVDETPVASETGPVYNAWPQSGLSKVNNCITFNADETSSVGPYVPEEKPAFELDTVYFDNSVAKWSEVYVYGWSGSGLNNEAVKMTQIPGTNIWSFEFDEPLSPGANCFLFKDTLSTWKNQTNDITVEEDMNCYKANAGSKSGGTWYYYGEKPTPKPPTPSGDNTLYFKTTLGWMTADGVSLFAYDTASGTSYLLEKDVDAYPNVYTAEVPESLNSVIIYRALEEVEETPVASETGPVYNAWAVKGLSKTNNCITFNADETSTVGPYVPEQKPEFELDRVYFDNSVAKWSEVYVYGWSGSGLNNEAVVMTQIPGTNIWYFDFDEPLSPGANCFLFKDTLSTWKNQTNNMVVEEGKNCYKANAGSKSGGTWYAYQG